MSGAVVWLTGLPSSGKSTLAASLLDRLRGKAALLDGDELRDALVPRPGYAPADRDAFYQTLAHLAALLAKQGLAVLVAATAHRRKWRTEARALAPRFIEVFVAVPAVECKRRDAKRLYARGVTEMPGADLPYEPPLSPEVVAFGGLDSTAAEAVLHLLASG